MTPPTNLITLTMTNEYLTVTNLAQVPSGPGIMGVRSVFTDGEESEVALYRYDLRRGKPSAPSATPVHIGTTNEVENSLTNRLRRIREGRRTMPPPLPPGIVGEAQAKAPQPFVRELPNATNWSYSQHLDWLADRAAKGKRRGE